MSLSNNALLRESVQALAGLVGETVSTETLSDNRLLQEQVRLLGLLQVGGGSGAALDRSTVTLTTPSLAAGAQHSAPLNLGATFALISVTVSSAARVRLYKTTAARTADAARARGIYPTDAVAPYLILDAALPLDGSLTLPMDITGSSTGEDGQVFALVDNAGASAAVITVSIIRLELEGVE